MTYRQSDHLRVSLGRTHSAVSRWYISSHHGALMQPTIERPVPVRFEDEDLGGYLPAHSVGLELGGREALRSLDFEWLANVANGRGPSRSDIQAQADANVGKQLGVSGTLRARGQLEWAVGGAWYVDRIPAAAPSAGGLDQRIASAHLQFRTSWLDHVGEFFVISDRARSTGDRSRHRAWYSVSTFGPWAVRPYVGFDGLAMDDGDAYYAGLPSVEFQKLGIRYDPGPYTLVRMEYCHSGSAARPEDEIRVQVAFAF